jgi:hypothetical protein
VKREDFLVRARHIKADCEQILTDCASWNENGRKPGEEPIEPDPDGSLRSAIAYCDGILNGEVYVALEKGPDV